MQMSMFTLCLFASILSSVGVSVCLYVCPSVCQPRPNFPCSHIAQMTPFLSTRVSSPPLYSCPTHLKRESPLGQG
jgi:hypothetical protein